MKIGILGGTFDPPHHGHLHLAREAKYELGLDKVLFVPAFVPPHKEDREITPISIRQKLVAALIENESDFELSDIEVKRGGVSYTVDTLKKLQSVYPPETEFYFLTGSDSLEILHSWKDWQDILKLVKFVVAARPGFPVSNLPPNAIRLDIIPVDVSSTLVRDCVCKGKGIGLLVPERVKYLIESEQLYHKPCSS